MEPNGNIYGSSYAVNNILHAIRIMAKQPPHISTYARVMPSQGPTLHCPDIEHSLSSHAWRPHEPTAWQFLSLHTPA